MTVSNSAYLEHLAVLTARADRALAAAGCEHLLVASGIEKYCFLDDTPYPFRANPQFKAWLPLTRHPHSWIAYTPGKRPLLVYYQPDDYWHVPPSAPAGDWVEYFDIRVIRDPADAVQHLPARGRCAILGEADAALPGITPNNPPALLAYLHYHRGNKTPYELALMRRAQRKAVRGHLAARDAFSAGASEAGIHAAYLQACGHSDFELPYNSIVGLNEHGATLHYQYKDIVAPGESRSLLIDAGADESGYAADITRSWGNGDADFEALIAAVDREQQALCAQVVAGRDYRELHLDCHRRLAGVLRELDVVRMDVEAMLAARITSVFFPHGLGHPIGLQVHDVGALHDEQGQPIPRPDGHPYLRLTRVLEPGMVVTIEPGIYFIPSLLATLRNGPHAGAVNWQKVEHLAHFGGVRIEDEVHCTTGAAENLTRDAFAELY